VRNACGLFRFLYLILSDLEPRFACKACGKSGADVRPDFN
jgi:hypothetical protein